MSPPLVHVVRYMRGRSDSREGNKGAERERGRWRGRPRDLIRLVGKIHAVPVALLAVACCSTTGIAPGIPVVSTFERLHGDRALLANYVVTRSHVNRGGTTVVVVR